jgi:hypothetical protein
MVLTKSIELISLIFIISVTLNHTSGLYQDSKNAEYAPICENLCQELIDNSNEELADFLNCGCSTISKNNSKLFYIVLTSQ